MIQIMTGNILDADAYVTVIPVNAVGVMGAGLAKQVKIKHPEVCSIYKKWCREGRLDAGGGVQIDYAANAEDRRIFYLMATKQHWRSPSQLHWIVEGLQNLSHAIDEGFPWATSAHGRTLGLAAGGTHGTCACSTCTSTSSGLLKIAIPKIGCGHGGLKWSVVKPLIFATLGLKNIDVHIYE